MFYDPDLPTISLCFLFRNRECGKGMFFVSKIATWSSKYVYVFIVGSKDTNMLLFLVILKKKR